MGSCAIRDAIALTVSLDTVRCTAKLGMASVDSDGGLRNPNAVRGGAVVCVEEPSFGSEASNSGTRAPVSMDSGTLENDIRQH